MMTRKGNILKPDFFRQPVLLVAPSLLGKYLVREIDGKRIEAMITEVEAYDGCDDLACHASKGRTSRTEVMFGKGGVWYVYLVYGMHQMVNIVTGEQGYPAAVLIRTVAGVRGPGRVTKYFQIDRSLNGKEGKKKSGLYIVDKGVEVKLKDIKTSPRIGVDYAGPVWSKKHYRFYLDI